MTFTDPRRSAPRIVVDGLCSVVTQGVDGLRPAAMIELSSQGLRIELPYERQAAKRQLQLEIELPGVDEIMWASGRVTFARLTPMGGVGADGLPRMWCRAGLAIDGAARRDLALLRDYVFEMDRARHAA